MSGSIELVGAEKVYGADGVTTVALHPTTLTIPRGQLVVLVGPSGSGKTTLMNLIGGLDRPSAGKVSIDGVELGGLDDDALCDVRRQRVGFVFQFFNLVPTLTAWENVALAAELVGQTRGADDALNSVGLAAKRDAFPAELSGGQQQRVAIARALAKQPEVLLCDEPTGALDQATGGEVLKLLVDAARVHGRTVIIVTHNPTYAPVADRVLLLRDGRIVEDTLNPRPEA